MKAWEGREIHPDHIVGQVLWALGGCDCLGNQGTQRATSQEPPSSLAWGVVIAS